MFYSFLLRNLVILHNGRVLIAAINSTSWTGEKNGPLIVGKSILFFTVQGLIKKSLTMKNASFAMFC